jgi:short-subunit dehydrogenase
MDLDGARILVAGATGALGGRLARALDDAGARVAVAGRDPGRLAAVASVLDAPALALELRDPAACRAAVAGAARALGGLDGLVIATGAVAFGPAEALDDAVAADLFAVNVLGPLALVAAALETIEGDGAIVALSAIVADMPTAGMAAYSASKAALSAHLTALRREVRRRGIAVLDVRPPHMETGFAGRALAGAPPALPAGQDPEALVATVLEAMRAGRREVLWDPAAKALAAR